MKQSRLAAIVRDCNLRSRGIFQEGVDTMLLTRDIAENIDNLIDRVQLHKKEPDFSEELKRRADRNPPSAFDDNKLFEKLVHLIAFSQNANSKAVEDVLESGALGEALAGFDVEEVAKMNPCDLVDVHWDKIGGIRQQAKLFHIVTLARRMREIGSLGNLLLNNGMPARIRNLNDIDMFWQAFDTLKQVMNDKKVPFFRSTTTLLHFLLEIGYDCVKPDLVLMKVARKIGMVEKESGEKNLVRAVRIIQEYAVDRQMRPAVVDLYFLIDGGQLAARKFVDSEYYVGEPSAVL